PKGDKLVVNFAKRAVVLPLGLKGEKVEVANTDIAETLAVSPSNRWLLAARNLIDKEKTPPAVRLFDLGPKSDGKPIPLQGAGPWLAKAAFSPDGKRVVSISNRPSVHVWAVTGKAKSPDWSLEKQNFIGKLPGDLGKGRWLTIGLAFRSPSEVVTVWDDS